MLKIGFIAAAAAIALAAIAQANPETALPLDRVALDPAAPLPADATAAISIPLDRPAAFLSGPVQSSAFDLSDRLQVRLTAVTLDPYRDLIQVPQAFALAPVDAAPFSLARSNLQLSAASLDWDYAEWGSLGLTASNSTSTLGLMGDVNVTPFSPASFTDNTATAGVAARVRLGDGWVTSFSYNIGVTQLSLKDTNAALGGDGGIQSRSYGVAIAKHGLFGEQDSLALSLSRRAEDYFGNVSLAGAGLDEHVDLLSSYRRVSLSGDRQETDLALGYVTTFLDGALALQANAGYQMNVAGQSGLNSLTVLSRAKINF